MDRVGSKHLYSSSHLQFVFRIYLLTHCACFHGNRCRYPNDSLTNENSLHEQEKIKVLVVVLKMLVISR